MIIEQVITLELAEERDAPLLADISKRAFHSDITCGADRQGGPDGYDSADWQICMMKSARAYFKIQLDEQVVGGAIVFCNGKGNYYLGRIFIDPEVQHQGIGTQAMALIFERFPNAHRWRLDTPRWNIRTKCFYLKMGFYIAKQTAEDYFFEKEVDA